MEPNGTLSDLRNEIRHNTERLEDIERRLSALHVEFAVCRERGAINKLAWDSRAYRQDSFIFWGVTIVGAWLMHSLLAHIFQVVK